MKKHAKNFAYLVLYAHAIYFTTWVFGSILLWDFATTDFDRYRPRILAYWFMAYVMWCYFDFKIAKYLALFGGLLIISAASTFMIVLIDMFVSFELVIPPQRDISLIFSIVFTLLLGWSLIEAVYKKIKKDS